MNDDIVPVRGTGRDGRYDHTKPQDKLPSWSYDRPWASHEEHLTTQALAVALMPGQEVADSVRPPLPQVIAFRPKFGYRTRALGIEDMIDINTEYAPNFNDYSGTPAGYQGASRNAQGSW
jgi:hypothetical protein